MCYNNAFSNTDLKGNSVENVHFSSKTDLWATPQEFFDKYDKIFNFETDVCANKENAKCAKFFTQEDDGLSQQWEGVCWMNPPYGRDIGKWMKKAYESSLGGALYRDWETP